MNARKKPTLVLDFDGVLHSYVSGWRGPQNIPDEPVPGAIDFCLDALDHFNILIVSSRCSQENGAKAIREWLKKYHFPEDILVSEDGRKPAAFITLDDRAITFTGIFPSPLALLNFKSWQGK